MPSNEHGPGPGVITRRRFLITTAAAFVAWQTSHLLTSVPEVPEEVPPPDFDSIPDGADLRGTRFSLADDDRRYTVELLLQGEELLLTLDGKSFQPDEHLQGKNVTHSDFVKAVLKQSQGIAVDCGAFGRAQVHKQHLVEAARLLVAAQEQDRHVSMPLTYRYVPPMLGIAFGEQTKNVSMKRVDSL